MDIIYRPATHADLPEINDVWYVNEVRGDPNPPAPRQLPGLQHQLEHGEMLVAERDGRVIGFAARIVRGDVAYLVDLFIRPEAQSEHVGRTLLEIVFPDDVPIRCTMSSTDFRAHARYIRSGVRPQWPNYWLRAISRELRDLPAADVSVQEVDPHDSELLIWDSELSGRARSQDIAYWLAKRGAVPLWFRRGERTLGYGFVHTRGGASLWYPDAFVVGPIGARTPEDASACVFAAVEWARSRAAVIQLPVPGPHSALSTLLDARCRIVYIETFYSSAADPFFDPALYLPSGDFL